jgi:hypothetical protein
MKTVLLRTVLGVASTLLISAALPTPGRSQETPPVSAPAEPEATAEAALILPAVTATVITPATPKEIEIMRVGETAIDLLAVSMVNEVKVALSLGAPEQAVDMCHLKTLASNGGTVSRVPRVSGARLTSLKTRSSDSAPDAADKLALEYVDGAMKAGNNVPKVVVQRVDKTDSPPEWRVYKPIGVSPNCLICHGNPADQTPNLRTKLKAYYPNDRASGYTEREWRGLIRVIVAENP